MTMQTRYHFVRRQRAAPALLFALFALFAGGSGRAAADEPVAPATGTAPAMPEIPVSAIDPPASWLMVKPRPVSDIGAPVDVARLAGMRGGEDDHGSVVVIDVDGTVDGNTAHHIDSGGNTITQGAFDNANGINTVIQNTGTNVLIQNAMVVTVNFADPAR